MSTLDIVMLIVSMITINIFVFVLGYSIGERKMLNRLQDTLTITQGIIDKYVIDTLNKKIDE